MPGCFAIGQDLTSTREKCPTAPMGEDEIQIDHPKQVQQSERLIRKGFLT
jgi:hypothetical protein